MAKEAATFAEAAAKAGLKIEDTKLFARDDYLDGIGEASGVVEAVGEGVTECRPGDRVMGRVRGAFAEYAVMYAGQVMEEGIAFRALVLRVLLVADRAFTTSRTSILNFLLHVTLSVLVLLLLGFWISHRRHE